MLEQLLLERVLRGVRDEDAGRYTQLMRQVDRMLGCVARGSLLSRDTRLPCFVGCAPQGGPRSRPASELFAVARPGPHRLFLDQLRARGISGTRGARGPFHATQWYLLVLKGAPRTPQFDLLPSSRAHPAASAWNWRRSAPATVSISSSRRIVRCRPLLSGSRHWAPQSIRWKPTWEPPGASSGCVKA